MKGQTSLENITEALHRLDFVIEKTNKILTHFNNTKGTDTHLFCLLIIDRLNTASFGLKNLLKDLFSTPQLEYSCAIILRSVLLDYVIVLNATIELSNGIKKEDRMCESLDLFCSTMLSESINYTLRDIVKLKLSSEELKVVYKNIAEKYPDYLEPCNSDSSAPIPKISKIYSPKELLGRIHSSNDFRQYIDAYEAYLFYSKYNHFSIMYYDFTRQTLEDRVYRINESTKVFPKAIQHILTILFILYSTDDEVKKQFKDINEYIKNN